MNTREDVVALWKSLLAKSGHLDPTLLIGSQDTQVKPPPDADELVKLSILEALGYTLANDSALGALEQVFLIAKGWCVKRQAGDGYRGALQPKHAPDRIACVTISHDDLRDGSWDMILYDQQRDANGALVELTRVPPLQDQHVANTIAQRAWRYARVIEAKASVYGEIAEATAAIADAIPNRGCERGRGTRVNEPRPPIRLLSLSKHTPGANAQLDP